MTIADKCPNCGARRGGLSPMVCYDPWHSTVPYKPELVFSFRLPNPHYSKTVTETELKRMIDEVKLADCSRMPPHEIMTLALAAEHMIELAKIRPPPMPIPTRPKLDPTTSIRRQLAIMLKDIGLNPDRYLNDPAKDIKPMCMPGAPADKNMSHQAARELATLLSSEIDVSVNPVILRLWLIERWEKVTKLAHKIHGGAS